MCSFGHLRPCVCCFGWTRCLRVLFCFQDRLAVSHSFSAWEAVTISLTLVCLVLGSLGHGVGPPLHSSVGAVCSRREQRAPAALVSLALRRSDMFGPRDVGSDLLTAARVLCLQHQPSFSLGPGWDTEPEGGDVCLGQAGPYR